MSTPTESLYKVAETRITMEQNKRSAGRPRNVEARKKQRLPFGFQPGPLDVICAKGSMAYSHSGNRWFRHFVEQQLPKYMTAQSRLEKSAVVTETLMSVRSASPSGGFVRSIEGTYHEIGDIKAREKISQAFRDLLHTQYKSSTKAKSIRRRMSMDTQSTMDSPGSDDTPRDGKDTPRGGGDNGFSPSGMMPMQVFIRQGAGPKPCMAPSGGPQASTNGLWPLLEMERRTNTRVDPDGDYPGGDDDASIGSFNDDFGELEPLPLAREDFDVNETLSVIESDIDSFFERDF